MSFYKNRRSLVKEGAGAGVLITIKDIVGQFDFYKENGSV